VEEATREGVTETVLVDREGLHLSLIEDPNKPYSVVKGFLIMKPPQETMHKLVDVNMNVRFRVYIVLELTNEKEPLFWSSGWQRSELETKVYQEIYNELPIKLREFLLRWFPVPEQELLIDPDPEPSHVRVTVFDETKAVSFDIQFDFVILIERVFTVSNLWERFVSTRVDPEKGTFFSKVERMREELREFIRNYFTEKFSDKTRWLSELVGSGLIYSGSLPSISRVEFYYISYRVPITFSYTNINDVIAGRAFSFFFRELRFTVPVPKETGKALKEDPSEKGKLTTFFNYVTLMGTEEALLSVGEEFSIEVRSVNVSEPKSLITLIRALERFVFS